ncbi:DUF4811 domain-containing protein [Bombilactobacillus folatiphilus]|uniref:DUF4811 domain-containing protein n=1 Tax=Bombilactobacillus folatiphilus TaxID=2923362 RepID=A0ABY4P9A2_9LACO|nr:DUF4811 domain-containing protein [Bombilactobacillus folatiphilus]UQS82196.1 DUF4811 domain-containing protein [Bombilactobacillus folatiphilus]
MILVILILGALATFISFVYLRKPIIRATATILSLLILGLSLLFLVLNDYNHYGMHQVSESKTTRIYPAKSANGMNLMLYKTVGSNGKETVQVYKTDPNQKKPVHSQVNEETISNNHIKATTKKHGSLKATTTRWRFDSNAAKIWFGVSGMDGKLVKRVNTFYVPNNWLHLSMSQVKQLSKKMKQMKTPAGQAQVKAQAQDYVKQKLAADMKKDPSLATNKVKLTALTKQYGQEFQLQLIKKAVAK